MVGHHAKMVWADVQDKVSAVVQEYCERVAVAHESGFITQQEADLMRIRLGGMTDYVAADIDDLAARIAGLDTTKRG